MSQQTVARSSRCLTCSSTPSAPLYTQRRLLSSSTSTRSIGPESPKYIEVPEPLQVQRAPLKPWKGILPVPRDVLDKRREYKATPRWIKKTAPEPSSTIDMARVPAHLRHQTEYRQRMAEMRRTNLREGITELYDRAVETDQETDRKDHRALLRNLKSLHAPPRHDETWTSHTMSIAVRNALSQKGTSWKPTPEQQAQRKAEVMRQQQERKDERLQSLHNLYLHAKDFIISEKQLDEEIDKVFGSEDVPITWAGGNQSVWATGKPKGTSEMIGATNRNSEDQLMHAREETNRQMLGRVRKIAGELTGGKIPVSEDAKQKRQVGGYLS